LTSPFSGWPRSFSLLAVAVAGVGFFFGVQLTLFNNFIVTRLGIEPHQLGYVEALREVPGFLNVLFVALMIRWAPPVVATLSLAVMGLGMAGYAWVDTVVSLGLFSVIWSLGFHCWVPLEQAMGLTFSPPGEKGKWLGKLRSVQSAAWLVAIGLCMLVLHHVGYESMFVLAGMAALGGGLALLFASRRRPAEPDTRFVFRRKYGLYYALNFLQGCRKQMFITFAIFALVKVHGMPVETTMILVFINQTLITLTGPLLGRLVDRLGERVMLSASYIGLVFVFAGYALIDHRPTLYVLYCIDNLIFFGSIALNTYIYRIADRVDLQSTLSMGVTMNHLAAVVAPFLGGLAWYHFGYKVIFISGSVLALISLVVSQWVSPNHHATEKS
jgi:predicted MFS family arabinose efflux permease